MELYIMFILLCIIGFFTFCIAYINILNRHTIHSNNMYILRILKYPGRYIIRAELAITILSFLVSNIAVESYAVSVIINLSNISNISFYILKYVAIIIVSIIVSYIITIFGKYLPRYMVIYDKEHINSKVLIMFLFFSYLLLPFTIIANIFEYLIKKILNKDLNKNYFASEIFEITSKEYEKGTIKKYEKELIDKVVKFDNLKVYDIYRKIENAITVDINSDLKSILYIFRKYEYSRIPVYQDTKNNIVGVLYIKDILYYYKRLEKGTIKLKSIIRLPIYENNNILISTLLRKMQDSKIHIAVIQEDNLNIGIITFEDIIEKLLGSIKDEFEN